MAQPRKKSSEDSEVHSGKQSAKIALPAWSKIVMGLLLLLLVVISLLSVQQINLLQLQNGQLTNRSSNLDQQFSDLNRIVTLGETQVLADHLTVSWTEGYVLLNLTCQCFKYSGYLRVNWTSLENVDFRFAQFNLNLTTPRTLTGNFRIPVSSAEPFSAWFEMNGCPSSLCSATYSAVYHY